MRAFMKYKLAALIAASLLPVSANADLVAHYTFDETSGNTAFDSALVNGAQDANKNQGPDVGWATGLIGGALELSGTNSMQAPDAIGEGATAFTLSMWVKFKSNPGAYRGIYSARNENWGLNVEGSSTASPSSTLHYDYRYDNQPDGSGGSFGVDSANGSAVLNEWQHIAMTWTADISEGNRFRDVYLNGEMIGSLPVERDTNPPTNPPTATTYSGFLSTWNIGDDPCCANREINAFLDDLGVWNEALSAAAIKQIYINGAAGFPIGSPPVTAGDASGDGLVNSVDFDAIKTNFYQSFADRTDGDLVNNNFIDFADYAQWKQVTPKDPNPGFGAGASVPEPSSLLLLAVAAFGICLLRR